MPHPNTGARTNLLWLRLAAKLYAGTSEHTMDVDRDPFLSDVEEDEVIIEDE